MNRPRRLEWLKSKAWAWVASLGLVGCGQESVRPELDHLATPAGATSGVARVDLRPADAAELARLLEKHRGNVVLVDFWATWCLPCIEQFPHTVALSRELSASGLTVISVSMDNPSSESQVRAFLQKQGAEFDNRISSYASPVEATKAFELPGPVPCYRVYDRKGNLHREFSVDPRAARQFSPGDIRSAVEDVL